MESFYASDDKNENKFFGFFSKLLRYLAVMVTLCSTAIYIALVSFHTDALPSSYAILLSQLRKNVLFPAMLEVFIVEFILELVRESLLRVPSKIGTATGIVGAIIIGNASVSAGIFDALVLILVCASLLASFAIPDYFSMYPIRILKFFVIFMTGIMGFYGFVLAISMILTNLVSVDSFGVPYFAPFAPYNRYDFKRAFVFSRILPRFAYSTCAIRTTRETYAHEHPAKCASGTATKTTRTAEARVSERPLAREPAPRLPVGAVGRVPVVAALHGRHQREEEAAEQRVRPPVGARPRGRCEARGPSLLLIFERVFSETSLHFMAETGCAKEKAFFTPQ